MMGNPVGEEVIYSVRPDIELEMGLAETDHPTSFRVFFFQCISRLSDILILSVAAIGGLLESLGSLWSNCYPLVVIVEEAEIMPRSALSFVITGLIAFAEIKSQGKTGFPFQTHPQSIMISITCLLIYGVASAFELAISAAEPGCLELRNTITTTAPCARDCLQSFAKSFTFY